MQRVKPARRHALFAVVVVLMADAVVTILLDGRLPEAIQWAFQAAVLLLLTAYLLLYVRERRSPRLQFGTASIFAFVTLAAFDAWAWRLGLGAPFTTMLVAGLLLYWRVWIRRYEPLGWLSVIIMCGLTFLFLLSSMFVTAYLLDLPKSEKAAVDSQPAVSSILIVGALHLAPATVGTLGTLPLC
jgi:hypothetical protein